MSGIRSNTQGGRPHYHCRRWSLCRACWVASIVVLSTQAIACDFGPRPLHVIIQEADAVVTGTMQPLADRGNASSLKLIVSESLKGSLLPGSTVCVRGKTIESEFFSYAEEGRPILIFLTRRKDGDWSASPQSYRTIGADAFIVEAARAFIDHLALKDGQDRDRGLLSVGLRYVALPDAASTPSIGMMKRGCAMLILGLVTKMGQKGVLSELERAHVSRTIYETGDARVAVPLFLALFPEMRREQRVTWLRHLAGNTMVRDSGPMLSVALRRDDELVEAAVLQRLREQPGERETGNLFHILLCASQAMRKKVVEEFNAKPGYAEQIRMVERSLVEKDP